MTNESIPVTETTVAATAFGAETEPAAKVTYDLLDPRFGQEAPRKPVTLNFSLKCVKSKTGKVCFRASDTALGTVLVIPEGAPADLIGKQGRLTLLALDGTKFAPSGELGFIMPTKPVKFGGFVAE